MPKIQIPPKLKPLLDTKAKMIVLIGGRGGSKSNSVGRLMIRDCQTQAADVMCGREFWTSIDNSVHKLLRNLISDIGVKGFKITDNKINCTTGGGFRFMGFNRNPDAIQSAEDFKYLWVEQAEALSQESIDKVLPTFRAPGYKQYFTANPQSSADPFSKRFILPFLDQIQCRGFYEDDMHLVIKINYYDNPWHEELESQRIWDLDNMTRAKYDWKWLGEFNDSVEDSLVLAEWFDACIDAHKKLGITPRGMKIASHDPSDTGPDDKGYAYRHGSVVLDVQERKDGDINEGCDWATGLAIKQQVDAFSWDGDGMGSGLKRQVSMAFEGKPATVSMFKGSEGPDFPEAIYQPVNTPIEGNVKNKDALKNKRAQFYSELRGRIYRTWEAVIKNVYHDPDTLLCFDSSIKLLPSLRAELCRMPIKPNANGLFEMYTKQEMKTKFKFKSPNLADAVMMSCRKPMVQINQDNYRPRPIQVMGIGANRRF